MTAATESTSPTGGGRARILGIGFYCLGILCMSIMDASAKWLTAGFALLQIIFFESLIGLVPAFFMLKRDGFRSVVTARWPLLVARGFCSIGTMLCFFFALKLNPLAEVTAVFAVGPLLMTLLAVPLLRERLDAPTLAAVSVGLLGAMMIVHPPSIDFEMSNLLPLGAATFYALAMIVSRVLVRTETDGAVVAYDYLVVMGLCAVFLPSFWVAPAPMDYLVFVIMGLGGSFSTYYRVKACRHAPVNTLAPFDYTGLLWAVILGYLVWGELPDAWGWLGAATIVGAGLFVLGRREQHAAHPVGDAATQPT